MAETVAEVRREVVELRRRIERLEARLRNEGNNSRNSILQDGMTVYAKDGDGNDSAGVLRFIIVEDSSGNKLATLPIIG